MEEYYLFLKSKRDDTIPFGPIIALGTFISIVLEGFNSMVSTSFAY